MSSFKHSAVLFTDDNGHPMKFFMRPCVEKQRLRPLIEHGGGVLSSKWTDGVYRLVEPGCKILNTSNSISSQFILDCVEKNCMQDIEKYRITVETAEISDISEDEAGKYTIRTTKRALRTRQEYTDNDDYTILDYIIKSKRYNDAKGRRIWINLQDSKVLPNRTWQSLKERYVKKIIPRIYKYDISEKHRKLLLKPFVSNGEEHNSSNESDDSHTFSDDQLILNSLFENNRLCKVSNNEVWKEIEDINKTRHSWKSLKDRFFKRIIPALNNYNLSLQQIDELNNAVSIPTSVLACAQDAAKNTVSITESKKSCITMSGNECIAYKNMDHSIKQKSDVQQSFLLGKNKMHKNRTDKSIASIPRDLTEPKTKKIKQALEIKTGSDVCRSPHKNNNDAILCPQALISPSSNSGDSDITTFENKCLTQYQFQCKRSLVPIKKLSMKAIQQHVAEIEKNSPKKLSSASDIQEWNLKNTESEAKQTDTSNMELSPEEMLDSQTSVNVQDIVDALNSEWPESIDQTLKLSYDESDDNHSTIVANSDDLKTIENVTEPSITKKSSVRKDNTENSSMSKDSSTIVLNNALTKNPNNECETSSNDGKNTIDSFCDQPLKYRKLRGKKKLIKESTKSDCALDNSNDHPITQCNISNRKRNIGNILLNMNSEKINNQDPTIGSSLNMALKHIKNIKEICENWCDSSDLTDISVPIKSVNCIQKELDELQILLYKTQLIFLSSEVMKKSQNDIEEDDILTLIKFLIVHGNYHLEDITNIISNKPNCH